MFPPVIRTLYLRMCQKREDSSLLKVMMSVSSLVFMGLQQEKIVVLGLSLNVARIILGWILSLLFSDFKT